LIHACAKQAARCEFLRGGKQDTAAGSFRISFDFRLIHDGMSREPRCPDMRHAARIGVHDVNGRAKVIGEHRPAVNR
jgi:hypothetical protein